MSRLLETATLVAVEDIEGTDETAGVELMATEMDGTDVVDSEETIDTIEDGTAIEGLDRTVDSVVSADEITVTVEEMALDGTDGVTMLDGGTVVERMDESGEDVAETDVAMLVVWMVNVLEEVIEMGCVELTEEEIDVPMLEEIVGEVADCMRLGELEIIVALDTSVM